MGHIKEKCRSTDKWAADEKSKSEEANLVSTASTSTAESESCVFLFIHLDPVSVIHLDPVSDSKSNSVITVNVASANRSANYWIPDT
jgi:hypothetical protein